MSTSVSSQSPSDPREHNTQYPDNDSENTDNKVDAIVE